jgi:hypothetical protein
MTDGNWLCFANSPRIHTNSTQRSRLALFFQSAFEPQRTQRAPRWWNWLCFFRSTTNEHSLLLFFWHGFTPFCVFFAVLNIFEPFLATENTEGTEMIKNGFALNFYFPLVLLLYAILHTTYDIILFNTYHTINPCFRQVKINIFAHLSFRPESHGVARRGKICLQNWPFRSVIPAKAGVQGVKSGFPPSREWQIGVPQQELIPSGLPTFGHLPKRFFSHSLLRMLVFTLFLHFFAKIRKILVRSAMMLSVSAKIPQNSTYRHCH